MLKKGSILGKSNPGGILRQPCRYCLKGTCTRSPCEYWHPPECRFFQNESGCKARDKCLFPHHKVDEQPNKKPKKKATSPKKKRESDDKNAVAIVKIVPQLGCESRKTRSYWILKRANKPGETRCKKSWDRFEEYDSLSLRYIEQVSGTSKDHRLEKYKSKILISEVPTLRNVRTCPMKRQQRCDRSKAWNLAKNIYKLKEKTRLHSTRPWRNGYSRLRQQKSPQEREFVVDSGASMYMVSKKDLNSAELETRRTLWSPATVMTANGEEQTREEATVYVKELDLFVTVMFLEEFPAVLSSTSSSQDSVFDGRRYTENPVPERSGSTSEELQGKPAA